MILAWHLLVAFPDDGRVSVKHEYFANNVAGTLNRAELDREKLLADHMPMVRKIAWHVHGRMSQAIEIDDLMQIGFGALIEALRGFENRGIDFKHYASTRVRGAMIDCLRREAHMSRGNMVNRRKMNAIRKKLEGEIGGAASDTQIADAMGISLSDYHDMVSATSADRFDSLDEVYSDHAIWFADQADSADTLVEKSQLMLELINKIDELAEREALILQLYFVEEMNLEEIGLLLEIGAARVCQIKKAALQKLRAKMTH
jgi:RNA polymerase sigma factor for flagellar operon FliA